MTLDLPRRAADILSSVFNGKAFWQLDAGHMKVAWCYWLVIAFSSETDSFSSHFWPSAGVQNNSPWHQTGRWNSIKTGDEKENSFSVYVSCCYREHSDMLSSHKSRGRQHVNFAPSLCNVWSMFLCTHTQAYCKYVCVKEMLWVVQHMLLICFIWNGRMSIWSSLDSIFGYCNQLNKMPTSTRTYSFNIKEIIR